MKTIIITVVLVLGVSFAAFNSAEGIVTTQIELKQLKTQPVRSYDETTSGHIGISYD